MNQRRKHHLLELTKAEAETLAGVLERLVQEDFKQRDRNDPDEVLVLHNGEPRTVWRIKGKIDRCLHPEDY